MTGGAGYVGSHAAKYLKRKGYTPIVLDNFSRGHRSAVKWGPFISADLSNKKALKRAFQLHPVEAVFHFAALAYVGESMEKPDVYYVNNVVGTLNLLEVMREMGVKTLVYSSSCATFGAPVHMPVMEDTNQNPINPYGWTKLIGERMIRDYCNAYGFRAVALRYFNAAGADPEREIGEIHDPEPHLIPRVIDVALKLKSALKVNGVDYPTKDGTCIRDYVHVTDLAQAHHLALEFIKNEASGFHAFNLGSERGSSVMDIIAAAERVCGHTVPFEAAPRRAGDPAQLIASSEKARRVLNWKPQYSDTDQLVETAWKFRIKHFGMENI